MKTGSATWSASFTKPHITTRLWDEMQLNCLDRKWVWTMESICCSLQLNVMKKMMAAVATAGLLLCFFISTSAGTSQFYLFYPVSNILLQSFFCYFRIHLQSDCVYISSFHDKKRAKLTILLLLVFFVCLFNEITPPKKEHQLIKRKNK